MSAPAVEKGLLRGAFPYVRVGEGRRRLVVFPGLNDALQPVDAAPRYWARFCRGVIKDRTVYLISRRRGLPAGMGTRAMAAAYARLVRDVIGPADVLGVSMGGFIAQYFAVDHAELVNRLILATTGARAEPDKLDLYRTWLTWAREGRWRDVFVDMMEKSYAGCGMSCDGSWMQASPKSVIRTELDPSDYIVSIEACLEHDSREVAGRIARPALVLGGTDDVLMPATASRDLAGRIPDARLELIDGAGHAVFETHRDTCARMINGFLA
jgi:pimeloyl-ACP methyl ester carboxylesterase